MESWQKVHPSNQWNFRNRAVCSVPVTDAFLTTLYSGVTRFTGVCKVNMPNSLLMQIKRYSTDKAFREVDANYLDVRFLSRSHPLSRYWRAILLTNAKRISSFSSCDSKQLGNNMTWRVYFLLKFSLFSWNFNKIITGSER